MQQARTKFVMIVSIRKLSTKTQEHEEIIALKDQNKSMFDKLRQVAGKYRDLENKQSNKRQHEEGHQKHNKTNRLSSRQGLLRT